jgi:hypothetical protein
MADSPPLPTIEFYTRAGCTPCAEARAALQLALEERAKRGDPIARVRYFDLAERPDLEANYGALVPVLAVGGHELKLSTSYRAIAHFLDLALGRLA